MSRFFSYLIFATFFILALGCASQKRTYLGEKSLYKKNNDDLKAQLIAYHINDSVTQIFFSFSNEELIYKRPDTSQWFYAIVKVRCALTNNITGKISSDSGNVLIADRQGEKVITKTVKGSILMKVRDGNRYTADINFLDINKKTRTQKTFEIDKINNETRQNFLLLKPNGELIYNYYLHHGDTVVIKSQRNKLENLVADHFHNEFPIAPPPFKTEIRSHFNYDPDSFFVLSRINNAFRIVVPEKGFYHIITNKDTKEGLTLYSVDASFPGIKNSYEMIRTSRYMMSNKEFSECLEATDKKAAIDDFWKDIGGSNERARELIKRYYGHVQESNSLFTAHQPGWQTDRGMIYIIFGAPTNVHKYANGETWVYGNEDQPNSVRFNFKKVLNPLSDNDYELERNEFYKDSWYHAVDHWRQGHIYLDN